MASHHVPRVKLAYFGTADVKYYGVATDRLPGYQPAPPGASVREVRPGDVVVVSATLLQGLYVPDSGRPLMDLLRPPGRWPSSAIPCSSTEPDFAFTLPEEEEAEP